MTDDFRAVGISRWFSLELPKTMKTEDRQQCDPCGTKRGEKCWGHCVDSRMVPMECEECGWIDDFEKDTINKENRRVGFCQDCDQERIFWLNNVIETVPKAFEAPEIQESTENQQQS